jgi:hypothetical protein
MPLPGIVEYFVNDLHGRPLLVVSEEVRGNLAKSLPAIIAAVRQVVGGQRFTVVFDRGGYDGQLFTWLVEQGLDFITYQRGDVHLAADQYHVLNHAMYKGLLFLGAGAIERAAGSRKIESLGGLIRRMPWTAVLFLIGVLGITGVRAACAPAWACSLWCAWDSESCQRSCCWPPTAPWRR